MPVLRNIIVSLFYLLCLVQEDKAIFLITAKHLVPVAGVHHDEAAL